MGRSCQRGVISVSYTHLDVYKRQTMGRSTREDQLRQVVAVLASIR